MYYKIYIFLYSIEEEKTLCKAVYSVCKIFIIKCIFTFLDLDLIDIKDNY